MPLPCIVGRHHRTLKPVSYDSYPGTEDIIYAVSPNLSGNTGAANAQVLFNFRHALS